MPTLTQFTAVESCYYKKTATKKKKKKERKGLCFWQKTVCTWIFCKAALHYFRCWSSNRTHL